MSGKNFAQGGVCNAVKYESNYGGGVMSNITAKDLAGNELAITQLINLYNERLDELNRVHRQLEDCKIDVSQLRTSPYMSVVAAIMSVCGAVLSGIGTNQITGDKPAPHATVVVWIGAILLVSASIATIFYPYAIRWFNKKQSAVLRGFREVPSKTLAREDVTIGK